MPHTIANPEGLHNPVPYGYSHTASVPTGTNPRGIDLKELVPAGAETQKPIGLLAY